MEDKLSFYNNRIPIDFYFMILLMLQFYVKKIFCHWWLSMESHRRVNTRKKVTDKNPPKKNIFYRLSCCFFFYSAIDYYSNGYRNGNIVSVLNLVHYIVTKRHITLLKTVFGNKNDIKQLFCDQTTTVCVCMWVCRFGQILSIRWINRIDRWNVSANSHANWTINEKKNMSAHTST